MRHIGSLLAGLVVAPLAWVLIAAGQPRTEQTFERWNTADDIYTGDVLGPLGLVLGAGLLVGLIVALRLSPLGPLVAGAFYLGVYGYAIREPVWVVDTLPQFEINGYRFDTVPPFVNGTMALAGAVLVVAALSRRRWQRWPVSDTAPAALVSPESPAPAGAGAYTPPEVPSGAAVYTPNEAVAGPPPAVGEGPLWPSTYSPSEPATTLTREEMFAGLTPGTAEDLPRRTPPKRPADGIPPGASETAPTTPSGAFPTPGTPGTPDGPPVDHEPSAGRTPVIPGPRHAAATEGWPLDSWPTSNPSDRPTIQPTFQAPPESPPTFQAPPESPPTDLTQPVPRPDEPALPTPPAPEQPTAPPSAPPNQPASQPADQAQPGPTDPPPRPINPLAQRPPVSPAPAGPPRPRPVNPLSPRSPMAPPDEPSDSTQRLPHQPNPGDGDEQPDPPTSPWSRPPRPPQET